MIYEIWCNGKLHYTRPEGHPDIQEALDLIETQKRLYGSASYEVRPTQDAADVVCTCRIMKIAGVGVVVNATGCAKHQPHR